MGRDGGRDEAAAVTGGAPSRRRRFSAWLLNSLSSTVDVKLRSRKERLFEGLSRERGVHTVLELGIGTAPNIRYYGADVDSIVGVDPNPAAWPYAQHAAAQAGLPLSRLHLVTARAEQLPLADESVDAVVATHVLCSVDSPQRALAEARRVLRAGGRYIFVEHVLAAPADSRLARLQHWVAPAVQVLADGCHVDRTSLEYIRAAGFSGVAAEEFYLDTPKLLAFWAPQVCGTAVK